MNIQCHSFSQPTNIPQEPNVYQFSFNTNCIEITINLVQVFLQKKNKQEENPKIKLPGKLFDSEDDRVFEHLPRKAEYP